LEVVLVQAISKKAKKGRGEMRKEENEGSEENDGVTQ